MYKRADGTIATADEALDERGMLKDGYGVSGGIMLRDSQVALQDHAQGEYERRISDGWRGNAPVTTSLKDDAEKAKAKQLRDGGLSAPQADYEARISNAWRS